IATAAPGRLPDPSWLPADRIAPWRANASWREASRHPGDKFPAADRGTAPPPPRLCLDVGGTATRARSPMSRSLPLVLFLLATGACDALVPDFPIVVSVEVLPSGPLARELQVTLREPARLAVRYWTGNGPIYRVESERGESHTLLIARLLPGRTYHYEVEGSGRTGTFESDLLPADLAAIDFRVEGRSTLPLVLVHLFHPDGFKGYAVLDPVGEVVWYWRTEDFPFGMARRPNGNFVFMDKGRGLVEVTPAGEVVHELPQELGGREVHHDLVVTPR